MAGLKNNQPITPGMKVKVHLQKQAFFGEVIALLFDGKLLLAGRPEFKALPLSAFDLFRSANEVEFFEPNTLMEHSNIEASVETVKFVVSKLFSITNPPAYCELRELNLAYGDLVVLKSKLLKTFGKEVDLTLHSTIADITTALR